MHWLVCAKEVPGCTNVPTPSSLVLMYIRSIRSIRTCMDVTLFCDVVVDTSKPTGSTLSRLRSATPRWHWALPWLLLFRLVFQGAWMAEHPYRCFYSTLFVCISVVHLVSLSRKEQPTDGIDMYVCMFVMCVLLCSAVFCCVLLCANQTHNKPKQNKTKQNKTKQKQKQKQKQKYRQSPSFKARD